LIRHITKQQVDVNSYGSGALAAHHVGDATEVKIPGTKKEPLNPYRVLDSNCRKISTLTITINQ